MKLPYRRMRHPPQEEKSSRGALGVRHGGSKARNARLAALWMVCLLSLVAVCGAAYAEVEIPGEVTVSGVADFQLRTQIESVLNAVTPSSPKGDGLGPDSALKM